jgi:hypothetical protein
MTLYRVMVGKREYQVEVSGNALVERRANPGETDAFE